MPAFEVAGQGRMAVFQDPTGAFISAWQPTTMGGFQTDAPNSFGWAELNARGIDTAIPFYDRVFGWTPKTQDMGEGGLYTEFQLAGESIAGGLEMSTMVPAEVPSYWMVYFTVADVDRCVRDGDRRRRARDGASARLPRRPVRDRRRPPGSHVRRDQDGGGLGSRTSKHDAERCSGVPGRADRDRTPVGFHQAARDGETQPGAL